MRSTLSIILGIFLSIGLSVVFISCGGGSDDSPTLIIDDTPTTIVDNEPTITDEEDPAIDDDSSNTEADAGSNILARIDPDLLPFFNSFIAEAEDRGILLNTSELRMSFVVQENPTIAGVCLTPIGVVEIDPFFRNRPELEELVYHELGHCLLGMNHRPNSIMQTSGFIGVTPETLEEFFSEEFFFQIPLFANPPRRNLRHVKFYNINDF